MCGCQQCTLRVGNAVFCTLSFPLPRPAIAAPPRDSDILRVHVFRSRQEHFHQLRQIAYSHITSFRMTARDMRDMLGLTGEVPRPAKKRKVMEKRPCMSRPEGSRRSIANGSKVEKGMAREVSALMGERAPPVSMIQVQPKYKQRPRRTQKVAPWLVILRWIARSKD